MACKNVLKFVNRLLSWGWWNNVNFRSLREGINANQQEMPTKLSMVHMYSLPWVLGDHPWVSRCFWWVSVNSTTFNTSTTDFLYFWIQPWPPEIAAGKGLHPAHPQVTKCGVPAKANDETLTESQLLNPIECNHPQWITLCSVCERDWGLLHCLKASDHAGSTSK